MPDELPRGRGPKKGKGSSVLLRITQETRDAMDAEAARTGRSLSQVGEIWLQEAVLGRATYEARLGGIGPAAAIEALARVAVLVRDQVGDPSISARARSALLEAWRIVTPKFLTSPLNEPRLREAIAAELALMRAADARLPFVLASDIALRGPVEAAARSAPTTPEKLNELQRAAEYPDFDSPDHLIQGFRDAVIQFRHHEATRLVVDVRGSLEGGAIARRFLTESVLAETAR